MQALVNGKKRTTITAKYLRMEEAGRRLLEKGEVGPRGKRSSEMRQKDNADSFLRLAEVPRRDWDLLLCSHAKGRGLF